MQLIRFQQRSFAETLSENEIIELVEGKVFEILKSAAKCKQDKLSRTATFQELGRYLPYCRLRQPRLGRTRCRYGGALWLRPLQLGS